MVMFSMLTWWYLDGFKDQFNRVKKMLVGVSDKFSISLLLKTLFNPFRMIDADQSYGPSLSGRIKAWLDRLISRMIGFFIRTVVVIIGTFILILTLIACILRVVFWLVIPILPFIILAVVMLWGAK